MRGSQGEWLYDANNYIWKDNDVENVKYGKDGYRLCHYHLVSTDLMFRYAMPWFPLPELMMTGISQPLIRASDAAAAYAFMRVTTPSG